MTKKLLLSIFLGLFFLAAQSQDFRGGLKAGANGSQVAGDCCSGYDKAGIFIGGFVNYPISEHSQLQMELEYSQKGSRRNPTEENGYQQYLLRLDYIDLPVLYQYVYGKFTFEIGLGYGYLLHTYEEADFSDQIAGTEFNRHALNLLGGLYYRFADQWQVNFRSTNSLMAVREHASGVKRLFNRGQYNDVLTLCLVYEFKKRR